MGQCDHVQVVLGTPASVMTSSPRDPGVEILVNKVLVILLVTILSFTILTLFRGRIRIVFHIDVFCRFINLSVGQGLFNDLKLLLQSVLTPFKPVQLSLIPGVDLLEGVLYFPREEPDLLYLDGLGELLVLV